MRGMLQHPRTLGYFECGSLTLQRLHKLVRKSAHYKMPMRRPNPATFGAHADDVSVGVSCNWSTTIALQEPQGLRQQPSTILESPLKEPQSLSAQATGFGIEATALSAKRWREITSNVLILNKCIHRPEGRVGNAQESRAKVLARTNAPTAAQLRLNACAPGARWLSTTTVNLMGKVYAWCPGRFITLSLRIRFLRLVILMRIRLGRWV